MTSQERALAAELAQAAQEGRISRRQLLERGAALALSGGALATALAACGGEASGPGGAGGGAGGGETRLLTIGDWGSGKDSAMEVAEGVRRYAAKNRVDLLLTVGDNHYGDSVDGFHRHWREYYGWVKPAGIRVAGALGNHDVDIAGGRYQFKTLDMPSRYYRRRVGNIEFLVLDSTDVDDRQTRWLEDALASSTARWTVPVFHHPVHSCGKYDGKDYDVTEWVPLFERHDVRLVLNGHDHNFQRFDGNGITYVVAGGGGASLYPLGACESRGPVQLAGESVHSFLYLQADGAQIEGVAMTPSGDPIDSFVVA